ncbi:UNKNOWN [Stylonychia lemnae]|uniref:Uncharacterized protein n=1 Tax=Stylonychia lemnae TaxID=5949 RepID=A0A078AWY6_STYLE|nr:UNKNOWN [Stylonychia lemnae]|eukprot:CDW86679.1 UNKNOWN [Stylonychia lemnae]
MNGFNGKNANSFQHGGNTGSNEYVIEFFLKILQGDYLKDQVQQRNTSHIVSTSNGGGSGSNLMNKFKFGLDQHQHTPKSFESDKNVYIDNHSPLISISQQYQAQGKQKANQSIDFSHISPININSLGQKQINQQTDVIGQQQQAKFGINNLAQRRISNERDNQHSNHRNQISSEKKNKSNQNTNELSRQMEKMKLQQFLLEKRRDDMWQKALTSLGQPPSILKELGREKIQATIEPFNISSVKCIKRGDYRTQKIKNVVFEVVNVEMIGNCYQVKLQIDATFHSDCKEYFSKQIRRGKVLIMSNVIYQASSRLCIGCSIFLESKKRLSNCEG